MTPKKKTVKKKVPTLAQVHEVAERGIAKARKNPKTESAMIPQPPKAGDTVSMAFHYIGLVSWELTEVEKVAKGKEVLWIDEQLYERKNDGTYVYEDHTLGPCKKVLHLDGGKRAREYEESGE